MMKNAPLGMIAKTLYGLEDVLADELTALGATDVAIGRRAVAFNGDKSILYKANLHCRTALRILVPVGQFEAHDADTVYRRVKEIEWDRYFTPDRTFAIDATVHSDTFNHSKFVAYRAKDAIADYFNERHGRRPSVRIKGPDMYINVHISHNDCTVSIDSSGESLHKRGYRADQGDAPLNEVLAAGMILKTGWRGESNFVDPMCGSGTLLIEAAMIALNIPPGLFRQSYAFERWADFDRELFEELYHDESGERDFAFRCYGSDISPAAIEAARRNVERAGLSRYIDLAVRPFQQCTEAPPAGILVTNPPYGERIRPDDINALYSMIGERLKHVFAGYQAWILSSKDEYFEKIGLRPSQKIKLMNGQLECEYRGYELFAGSNKEYKRTLSEQRPKPADHMTADRPPHSRRATARPTYRSERKPFDRTDRKPTARPDRPPYGKTPARPARKPYGPDRRADDAVPQRPDRRPFDRHDRRLDDRPDRRSPGKTARRPSDKPFGPARKPFDRPYGKSNKPDKPFRREK